MRLFLYFLVGLIVLMVWSFISLSVLTSLGPPVEVGDFVIKEADLGYEIWDCLWPSVWEEVLYRWGPIQIARSFKKPEIIWPTILMSSAIFGWGHLDGQQGVFIQGTMGVVLSYIYLKTNKIWLCMLIHGTYNIIVTFGPSWLQ